MNYSRWPTKDGLRVGHLNICHIINKMTDVCRLMHNNDKFFHIFGFSESWTKECMTNNLISITGYNLIRKNCKQKFETGLVVYVHNSINFKIRDDLCFPNIEIIWLEIICNHKTSDTLLVGFIYRHPKSNSKWYDNFIDMMDRVWLLNKEILLLGDLNIDFFQPCPKWSNIINAFNLHQCVHSATRTPNSSASSSTLIDHLYSSNPSSIFEICVPKISVSDHNAIFAVWNKKGFKISKNHHSVITFRSYKHFNLSSYYADLSVAPFSNIYSFTDPDSALEFWCSTFLDVVNKHIPLTQKRVKSSILPIWLTTEILTEMLKRDKLRNSGSYNDFKKQRNLVQYMIRKSKRDSFRKLVQDKRNGSLIWKAIHQLTKPYTSNNKCSIPVDVLNNHFSTIGDTLNSTNKNIHSFDSSNLQQFCKSKINEETFSIPLLSTHEVFVYLSSLNNKNSSGFDGISPKILKLSAPYVVDSLTYLFNLCLSQNYFPKLFKHAKVIPLFKKGDINDCNNYRPISLLSSISKPLERHIHSHFSSFIEKHQLFHTHQSGFRKLHSCETALCRITDSWLSEINNRKAVGVIFIDFTKAFDMINHTILIEKLKMYGIDKNAECFFTSYLSNRSQSVCLDGSISSERVISRGVPQGSILGPLLFSLYINDLPLSVQHAICDLFADDTSLQNANYNIDHINHHLNQSMKSLENWCDSNDMLVHPKKTECMLICPCQRRA